MRKKQHDLKRLTALLTAFLLFTTMFTVLPLSAAAEERPLADYTVDFEDVSPGDAAPETLNQAKDGFSAITVSNLGTTGEATIMADPLGGGKGNVLKLESGAETTEDTTQTRREVSFKIPQPKWSENAKSLRISFDMAFSKEDVREGAYFRHSTAGDLVSFAGNRGDGFALLGLNVLDKKPITKDTWYHFEYELRLTDPAHVYGTGIISDGHGFEKTVTSVLTSKLDRREAQYIDFFCNPADGYIYIDNLKYQESDQATPSIVIDSTVDFEEMNTGAFNNDQLQAAKDQWGNLNPYTQWYDPDAQKVVGGDRNAADLTIVDRAALSGALKGEGKTLKITKDPNKTYKNADGSFLGNTGMIWFSPITNSYRESETQPFGGITRRVYPDTVLNISYEMAVEGQSRSNRNMQFRCTNNSPDRILLLASRDDGAIVLGDHGGLYNGGALKNGMEPGTWHRFDYQIIPRGLSKDSNVKTQMKAWIDGLYVGTQDLDSLTSLENVDGKTVPYFERFYLDMANGSDAIKGGDATYLDNFKYQVVTLNEAYDLGNANPKIDAGIANDAVYVDSNATVGDLGDWTGNGISGTAVEKKSGGAAAPTDKLLDCRLVVTRINGLDVYYDFLDYSLAETPLWGPFDFSDTSAFVHSGNNGDLVPNGLTNNRAFDDIPNVDPPEKFQKITYDTAGLAGRDSNDKHMKVAAKGATPKDPSPDFQVNAGFANHTGDEAVHFGLSVLLDDPKNQGSHFVLQPRGTDDAIKGDFLAIRPNGTTTGDKTFRQGEWVRLDVVWKPKEKLLIGYINGEEAVRQTIDYTLKAMKFRYSIGQGDKDFAFYLDDLGASYGLPPQLNPVSGFITGGNGIAVNHETHEIRVPNGLTVQQLWERAGVTVDNAKVYTDHSFQTALDSGAVLESGNEVALSDGVSYGYWTILAAKAGYTYDGMTLTSSGLSTTDTFVEGNLTATANFTLYEDSEIPAMLLIGQYDAADGNRLLKAATSTAVVKPGAIDAFAGSAATLTATLPVEKAQGTQIKVMLWNPLTLAPLDDVTVLRPADTTAITSVKKMYPGFTTKAVTFSFDDGRPEDPQLIQVFDRYGIKGTFNLVSNQNVMSGTIDEAKKESLRQTYAGQEIANHVKNHPAIGEKTSRPPDGIVKSAQEFIDLIEAGQQELEAVFGDGSVPGLAWPYNDPMVYATDQPEMAKAVSDYVKNSAEIEYARRSDTNSSFDLPEDFKDWVFTTHYTGIPSLGAQFLALEEGDDLKLMSIWGHAYEFAEPEKPISLIEDFLDKVTAQNIWIPTNIQLVRYVKALEQLQWEMGGNTVSNPSEEDVCVVVNARPVVIKAGETYTLYQEDMLQTATIFLAGDSTCENVPASGYPRTGWGSVFDQFVSGIRVDNSQSLADMSTRTFLDPKYSADQIHSRYENIMNAAKPGDYVFIQFGHNDSMSSREWKYTTLEQYRENLNTMVTMAREKGVTPVFLTSTQTYSFDGNGIIQDNNGAKAYRAAMMEEGEKLGVVSIDIGALHRAYLQSVGAQEAKKLFLFQGITPEYKGSTDDLTHPSPQGAEAIARIVARAIKNVPELGLSYYMK